MCSGAGEKRPPNGTNVLLANITIVMLLQSSLFKLYLFVNGLLNKKYIVTS